MHVTEQMVDQALVAWFKSPPNESDLGLERSMRAALEAALSALPWPEGFYTLGGDNRLRECASDGCHQHVSMRVEHGGVGSDHCEPCARKIAIGVTQYSEMRPFVVQAVKYARESDTAIRSALAGEVKL